MTASIAPPFPSFFGLDGRPLDGGYVFIGVAGMDAESNPEDIFWDADRTIAASQPVRTLAGFLSRSGTPANIYTPSDFSIKVKDRNGVVQYSAESYTLRINADNVTFGELVVGTSILPDGPGGAFNGSEALPWSSLITREAKARDLSIFNQTQPAETADLVKLNQRAMPLCIGTQTNGGASVTWNNIYNVDTVASVYVATGIYEIHPTIALPNSNYVVLLTPRLTPGSDITLSCTARNTTQFTVEARAAGAAADMIFDFLVFGFADVADPIL